MAQLQQLNDPSVLFMGLCLFVMYASFISVVNEAFVVAGGLMAMLVLESQSSGEGFCPCKAGPSATRVTAYRTGFGGYHSKGVTWTVLKMSCNCEWEVGLTSRAGGAWVPGAPMPTKSDHTPCESVK